MRNRMKLGRPSHATVVAYIALFVALGGSAYAVKQLPKNSVGPKQLRKNAVTKKKVRKNAISTPKIVNNAVTGAKVKESTLGTVPTANTANLANSLPPSEGWHEVGAPGEPYFENSWENWTLLPELEHAGFYKDHEGIVHLRGHVTGGTSFLIFHLPPGYRPASGKSIYILTACDGGPCSATKVGNLGISGSGIVSVIPGVTFVTFDGISFRAES
jgi:hypothetical protein